MGRVDIVHNAVKSMKPKKTNKTRHGLSSGSTMLNLACSGRTDAAFYPGCVYHVVGDSSSGKTAELLTVLAEASIDPFFDDYDLEFDDAENGAFFDLENMFSRKVAERIKAPRYDKSGEPVFSEYLEDLYDSLDDKYRSGRKFIRVIDSMDVLWPREDETKYQKQKEVRRKKAAGTATANDKESGNYGMAKAKRNSELLRVAIPKIRKSGSILFLISQAKTAVNEQYGDGKTSAGGLALKFYSSLQLWFSVREHIKKTVNGREREIGIRSAVRIKKNRQTGKDRKVVIPFYHATGFDDVGGMVDFLLEEGYWKKGNGGINAKDFGYKGNREAIVKQIEENDDEQELRQIVKGVWDEIESACKVDRKRRYV